ncbi:MAG: phosphopantetheine-binding protein [Janthinobacterium lividum]
MTVQIRETALDTSFPTDRQSSFERELAELTVHTLQLEIGADEIDAMAPLFGEGLGLDSIDALELSLAISRRYGVELKSDDERNGEIFSSLRNLSAHVAACRTC